MNERKNEIIKERNNERTTEKSIDQSAFNYISLAVINELLLLYRLNIFQAF